MMDKLFASLSSRQRPEDVADLVLLVLGDSLSVSERATIERAARGSLRQQVFGYTSMLQEFAQPTGIQKQVARARDLFSSAYAMTDAACDDPEQIEWFIRSVGVEVLKAFETSDFMHDRLNASQRRGLGLKVSRRRYNRKFRHLCRMEGKLKTLLRELKKREFTMIGKSGLASKLDQAEFLRDRDAACFVAYYTARANLRSEFTVSGQQKAYDEIADILFRRCRRSTNSNWWSIAHVYPVREVLMNLNENQKGELLGRWHEVLVDVADLLREVWERSDFDRETMIVARGNDSTTWNNTANAWNTARQHWIALLHAMDLDDMLDALCPGKVLRLMAADVVAWHRAVGGGLSPDTFVWRDLPLPWEALSGSRSCSRAEVERVCSLRGVDPARAGWTAPRHPRGPARYRPTPELVHGVTVSSPQLASLLRSAGWFSGKLVTTGKLYGGAQSH